MYAVMNVKAIRRKLFIIFCKQQKAASGSRLSLSFLILPLFKTGLKAN